MGEKGCGLNIDTNNRLTHDLTISIPKFEFLTSI